MKKAFINSLPKAGTNLLAKCLELFGYSQENHIGSSMVLGRKFRSRINRLKWHSLRQGYMVGIDTPVEISRQPIDKILGSIRDAQFCTAHVGYTSDFLFKLNELDIKSILVIRDPRAVLSSFVHYVSASKNHPLYCTFSSMNNKERYLAAMNGMSSSNIFLQPLRVRCNSIASWLESNNVLTVKFEDIVGCEGGGNDDRQREVLVEICNCLDISKDKIDYVQENLFGQGRRTFRKGNINSWQDEIPEDLQGSISNELSDVLSNWGYSV